MERQNATVLRDLCADIAVIRSGILLIRRPARGHGEKLVVVGAAAPATR